ncbi:MAG: right-handed parallel beta-helix repeat-containing protein [Planctomycetota bacterium]|jgi:hypothetical protein
MQKRNCKTLWCCLAIGAAIVTTQLQGAIYYVDSQTGNDTHSGLSPTQAWASLDRVNQSDFAAGDRILLKRGTRYTGQLRPGSSGREGRPIVISSYGLGALPRIDGNGVFLDAVLIRNIEYVELSDLEITNEGTHRKPWQTGVRIAAEDAGPLRHLHLRGLYVHDVYGDLRKTHEGCGIYFEAKGNADARFEDLLIENCHVVRTDRNGICQRRSGSASRSTGVVIRGNLLEDIGGDGIKPWGSNGALVEYNIVRGGRMRCLDAAAGIWPWDCDDTIIQFNEVSGMKGTRDGQGFDSDYRCRNTLFQYNYSHDNEGGFMLICSPGNSYCENTVVRYNISQNDGINSARVFHFGGGTAHTSIYNNVIYIGPHQRLPLFLFTEWSRGNARDVRIFNNIFYVDGQVTYEWGKSRNVIFENNVFYGKHLEPPADPHALTQRPPLIDPGSGGHGLESLGGYRLRQMDRDFLGQRVDDPGTQDFFGNALPSDKPVYVGVHHAQRTGP